MSNAASAEVPSEADILARLAPIVAESLRIDRSEVQLSTTLRELGAESLDLVQINLDVESEFDIYLPEKDILSTAQERFGPNVLTIDGNVTAAGRELLLARMPELAGLSVPDPLPIAAVESLFLRVDVWVRLIRQLCQLRAARRTEAVSDAAPPSADEWNREWVDGYIAERYPDGLPRPSASQ